MAGTSLIKLVGPDMPVEGLKCTIEVTGTVAQLRVLAYSLLPAPTGLSLAGLGQRRARSAGWRLTAAPMHRVCRWRDGA